MFFFIATRHDQTNRKLTFFHTLYRLNLNFSRQQNLVRPKSWVTRHKEDTRWSSLPMVLDSTIAEIRLRIKFMLLKSCSTCQKGHSKVFSTAFAIALSEIFPVSWQVTSVYRLHRLFSQYIAACILRVIYTNICLIDWKHYSIIFSANTSRNFRKMKSYLSSKYFFTSLYLCLTLTVCVWLHTSSNYA